MNALEGAWILARIGITNDWGAPHTIDWSDGTWRGQSDNFPQDKIRALVGRTTAINILIIRLEGEIKFHR